MVYIYVQTLDGFSRLPKAIEFAKKLKEEYKFLVNDIRAIDHLRQQGIKAVNLDAVFDCLNIVEYTDKLFFFTDEETEGLKLNYSEAKEIK